MPVPLRLTVCGELGAVSLNCKVSVFAPLVCGVNFKPTLHDAPGVSDFCAVQVDDAIVKSVAEARPTELIVAAVELPDGLVRVTETFELVRPVFTLPKETDVRDKVSGAGVGWAVGVGCGVGVAVGVGVGVGVACEPL